MSVEHWETYYRGGALATCPISRSGNYDDEMRQVWEVFLADLPDGARVLDIGTGNGAIALIARDTAASAQLTWEIHGTDLAMIDPWRDVPNARERLAGIHFHPGVPSEQLPFPDNHFAAVCGHYALEYCDVARALREVSRVLKPAGQAQFVLHHADSLLVRAARLSLGEADLILRGAKIYRRLERLVTLDNPTKKTLERAAVELQAGIRQLKQALPHAQRAGGGRLLLVTLDSVKKLLEARTRMRPAAMIKELERAETEIRSAARRLNDLVAHACDAERLQELNRSATSVHLKELCCEPLHHNDTNLVGWRVHFEKTA